MNVKKYEGEDNGVVLTSGEECLSFDIYQILIFVEWEAIQNYQIFNEIKF